jgi:hypothetical protein
MFSGAGRPILAALALACACGPLAACDSKPGDFGITGPSPGMSLTPPVPTPAQEAARANPDSAAAIPGVRTGTDVYAPSVLTGPVTPGSYFGAD